MKDSSPRNGLPLVLVVDDDPAVRRLVSAFLELICCRVLAAADGLEALLIYCGERHPLSLLVTDIDMPGIDGFALAQELTELQPGLKVVYISGGAEIVANRVSNSVWISKPFEAGVFLTKVRQLLPCT